MQAALPGPGAGLIAGLAVGETSAVDAELDAAMKATSLAHLTAVSGANCALVVGVAFGAAALCGARRGARVAAGLGDGAELSFMQSNGGLAAAHAFRGKDAILSGPAGGVVG